MADLLARMAKKYPDEGKYLKGLGMDGIQKLAEWFSGLIWEDLTDNWEYLAKDRRRMAVQLRADWVVKNMGFFSAQVEDQEDKRIKDLNSMDFSVGEIAYIVGRSKSTVHAHL